MPVREDSKLWRLANPDKVKAQQHRYYARHRAKRLAAQKAYYAANADERRQYAKRYRDENAEKVRAAQAEYYARNRERFYEAVRRRQALLAGAPVVEKIDRKYIIARDKRICHICWKRVTGKVELDHLVPLSKGGSHTHDNLAVSHPHCNRSRHDGRLPAQLLLVG